MVRTLTDAAAVPEEKAVSNTAVAEARWWSFMAAGVMCRSSFRFCKNKNYEIKLSYKFTRDGMKQLSTKMCTHVEHVGFCTNSFKTLQKHKPNRFVGALRVKRVSDFFN